MKRASKGFTLVELVVACGLMMIVLTGVMMVTASAMRSHVTQIRSGQDSTSEMYGIDNMVRDFENTTHLEACYPPSNSQTSASGLPTLPPDYCTTASQTSYQEVRGCLNWSESLNPAGAIDAEGESAGTDPVEWYDYCWSPPGPGGNGPHVTGLGGVDAGAVATLFEYTGNGCPHGAWPAITQANCGTTVAGTKPRAIVLNFYPLGYTSNSATSQPVFTRADWKGGIAMQFMVGVATSEYTGTGVAGGYANQAVPVIYQMTTGSGMQKNYNVPTCAGMPCD